MASTARRRQLGQWLRKLRTDASLTPTEAAEHLGCSEAKIRHWEAARSGAKKVELDALLKHYGADEEVRRQLEELRKDGTKRGWWTSYKLPHWFAPFVGFETDATKANNFELGMIPGLFQTEDYIRELHKTGRHTPNTDVEKWVEVRIARQQRLTTEPKLEFRTVIAEEALHRNVGGSRVMHAQLRRIIEATQLPNVIVQVLPFRAGAHACPSGSFVVLSFDADDEDIGFTDTPLGGHVLDESADVEALQYLFDELRSIALSAPDSLELLRTIVDEYKETDRR